MRKQSRPDRTLYLAAIGQLVLWRNIDHATSILKALLVISQSKTEVNIKETEIPTLCETQ